jgi:adenylate cyclase
MSEAAESGGTNRPEPYTTKTAGTLNRVFISYSSQDATVAARTCAALEAAGLPCWIAPRDVRAGESYAAAIVEAISSCRMLVLLLSQGAISSPHVLREVERASSKRRPVLSVRMDAAKLPPDLEYFLSANQWLDASGSPFEQVLPALIESVRDYKGCMSGAALGAGSPAVHSGSAPVSPAAPGEPSTRWGSRAMALGLAVLTVVLGYVLVKELWLSKHAVTEQAVAVAHVAPANAAGATPIPEKSIAVLPFTDMSEKKNQEYFSDGLSEELIDKLSQIPDLRVPAQTSSFYFKGKQATVAEIAKALSVAHILEGSVRKSGSHLRITAQLIRGDSGYNLWSETYDRQLDEIFKVQDEIAAAVVGALKVRLLSAQPTTHSQHTTNADAYNDYLLGRNFYLNRPTRDGPRLAIEAYRKAIELDPGYGLAYAGLAEAESLAADAFNDEKGQERALADAERAVLLAPKVADVYGVRGHLRHTHSWDWVGAQADFEKAVALNGREPVIQTHYAELLATVGRLSEAVAATRIATEVDPLSELASRRLGQYLYCQGDLKAAREALSLALALNPESIYSRWHLGVVELLDGHPQQALVAFQQDKDPVFHLNGVALAEYSLGHTEAARAALDQLIRTNAVQAADYQIADVYGWRADRDHAFEWLERALARRDGGLTFVKIDPLLASLHSDPRYKAFLRKVNLSE